MLITVVGNDSRSCGQLQDLLAKEGYQILLSTTGNSPLDILRANRPSLAIFLPASNAKLDLNKALRELRKDKGLQKLPVICVSSKTPARDVVSYLDDGADDVIGQPFNTEIFLARVRMLLRRRVWSGAETQDAKTVLECGPLTVNLVTREASLGKSPLQLTHLEFNLLTYLIKSCVDRICSREELLQSVWRYPEDVQMNTRTVDKHIETLRRKLGSYGTIIKTVRGSGYQLIGDGVAPAPAESPS